MNAQKAITGRDAKKILMNVRVCHVSTVRTVMTVLMAMFANVAPVLLESSVSLISMNASHGLV